jgi:hypothetical protein
MPGNLLAVLNEPNAPLQATAAATLALLLKHIVTVFAQGGARFGAGMRPPEDVCFMPAAGAQSFDGTAKAAEKGNENKGLKKARETEQRWTRIVANDLENIPLVGPPPSLLLSLPHQGLIIAWGALQSLRVCPLWSRRSITTSTYLYFPLFFFSLTSFSLPPSLPPSLPHQGLIIAWGALQSPLSAPAHVVLVLSFALSRVLHTVTYAMGKQPHRAIAFFGGLLSVVGLSVNGLLGALGKK